MSTPSPSTLEALEQPDEFIGRHIGPSPDDERRMLATLGVASRAALVDQLVPPEIRRTTPMNLPAAIPEAAALAELRAIAAKNRVLRSFIGQGYYGTFVPAVIRRNLYENPGWYTGYTPYQSEISQGRLEALVNFQTMVTDLTGMDIANASLLDEATAAAEAMTLARRVAKSRSTVFFVADDVLPQTRAVVQTRAAALGMDVACGPADAAGASACFAVLLQYPGVSGEIRDLRADIAAVHAAGALAVVAADLLALTLLAPPGELGADVVVGSTQRFGTPMANGGPHAAYLACRDAFKRSMPGRLVGVSVDAHGRPAYRLALQTREQHIRREKATSNICTAQVLPALLASMYAVYHGPEGLTRIARRVATYTAILAAGLRRLGATPINRHAFDTLTLATGSATAALLERAVAAGMNLRRVDAGHVGISLDETTTRADITALWRLFPGAQPEIEACVAAGLPSLLPEQLVRTSPFLAHPVFHAYHSETAMLRYLRALADRDLALDRTMIPLGSCTLKLNAASEMIPVTWPEFADIHPFAPADQRAGYAALERQLRAWLVEATGYADVTLEPNAGSQGEYTGLLAIRAWHEARGDHRRTLCLIPESAHGTNPASAHLAGLEVLPIKCDARGDIDLDDLQAQCRAHADTLAAVMVTYPSTHGVFEAGMRRLAEIVHAHGGRVYVDGANMNALVGIAAPGQFGGDVSHLNLHKTFCVPHGGGGPGVGPVAAVADLVPFLPRHGSVGPVAAAPLGNAGVLPISWMYIRMMGAPGLTAATETAILNANYIAARLSEAYPVLYNAGRPVRGGGVAHECILDLRPLKETSGISAEDVAKRLVDYGFHAPTLSFPVPGTLMVEPTESEPLAELDRFCDAMLAIRAEIARVAAGEWPRTDNPLVNAPHTAEAVTAENWPHPYGRELAAYPVATLRARKYWPPVARVDNVYGDRHLFCSCVPLPDRGAD